MAAWPFGVLAVVGTVSYWWAGRASGFGVLIGGRADERQALIRARARSRNAMIATAVIGVLIEVTLGFDHHLGSLKVMPAAHRCRCRQLSASPNLDQP
jgi:hypothetical protein